MLNMYHKVHVFHEYVRKYRVGIVCDKYKLTACVKLHMHAENWMIIITLINVLPLVVDLPAAKSCLAIDDGVRLHLLVRFIFY